MVERRGADWKKYATHVRFTSNMNENIAEFWPRGLKRLEMLLQPREEEGTSFRRRRTLPLFPARLKRSTSAQRCLSAWQPVPFPRQRSVLSEGPTQHKHEQRRT
jgi:hypothetical protein